MTVKEDYYYKDNYDAYLESTVTANGSEKQISPSAVAAKGFEAGTMMHILRML